MTAPRSTLGGAYGSGTTLQPIRPVDIGGGIQDALSGASTLIHNAYLRKQAGRHQEIQMAQATAMQQDREEQRRNEKLKSDRDFMVHGGTPGANGQPDRFDPMAGEGVAKADVVGETKRVAAELLAGERRDHDERIAQMRREHDTAIGELRQRLTTMGAEGAAGRVASRLDGPAGEAEVQLDTMNSQQVALYLKNKYKLSEADSFAAVSKAQANRVSRGLKVGQTRRTDAQAKSTEGKTDAAAAFADALGGGGGTGALPSAADTWDELVKGGLKPDAATAEVHKRIAAKTVQP